MDQHPIPQNVTGFQFKLIGAMTVKQFGYVAVGVIAAFVTYYIPIHGFFAIIFKIFMIPLLGASGPVLAFVPVDGRPIDVMTGNFVKALLSPNQYVYHKGVKKFSFSTVSLSKPKPTSAEHKAPSTPKQKMINERGHELQKLLIRSSGTKIKNAQDEHEAAFLNSILSTQPAAAPLPASTHSPLPTVSVELPTPEPKVAETKPLIISPPTNKPTPEILSEKEEALKKQLDFTKREETSPHSTTDLSAIHQKAGILEKQVQEIHTQKQALEEEILQLKKQLSTQQTTTTSPAAKNAIVSTPTPFPPLKQQPPHVRSVPKEQNKRLGIFVSDTPNVVSGMVKDARGNVLPNILVEIKDKASNPVRAFKTNALGNFASATPLAAGTYTITLEDLKKQHTFDSIQITANDQIMLPIEIISYDKREALRKDLFS